MLRKKQLSRRDFLRMSGATVGGALALGGFPNIYRTYNVNAQPDTTINVLTVGDPWDFALRAVADQFTEETGIGVNLETLAYPALHNRLINSFITQQADADVIAVDQMWISQYSDNNWIRSLDEFIAADSDTDVMDFLPEALYSLSTWRGSVMTLPVGAYSQGVIYRTDLVEEAGLDPVPTTVDEAGEWTWAKYFEYLDALSGMEDIFPTVVIGAQPVPVVHMFTQLSASYGTRWFEQFPAAPWDFTPTINSEQNVMALTDWKRLYDMSPPESINYVWFDAGTRFSGGADIGMFYHWSAYFYLVKDSGYLTGDPSSVADSYAVGLLPTLEPGGDQVVSLGGWSLGMPSTSETQDEAWQFIKWATSADTQKAMGLVPDIGFQFSDFSRASLYQDEELREIYPYLDTQFTTMAMGNGKIVRPPATVYTTLEGVYGLQLNQVMSGSTTPEDALATTETLFANILSGNQLIPYELESYDDTLENTIALMESLSS